MGKGAGGGVAKAPEIEPIKSAETAMKDAKDESARAQRMRRAVAGTFSRSSMSGYAPSASATAGAAAKLGA